MWTYNLWTLVWTCMCNSSLVKFHCYNDYRPELCRYPLLFFVNHIATLIPLRCYCIPGNALWHSTVTQECMNLSYVDVFPFDYCHCTSSDWHGCNSGCMNIIQSTSSRNRSFNFLPWPWSTAVWDIIQICNPVPLGDDTLWYMVVLGCSWWPKA